MIIRSMQELFSRQLKHLIEPSISRVVEHFANFPGFFTALWNRKCFEVGLWIREKGFFSETAAFWIITLPSDFAIAIFFSLWWHTVNWVVLNTLIFAFCILKNGKQEKVDWTIVDAIWWEIFDRSYLQLPDKTTYWKTVKWQLDYFYKWTCF